MARAPWSNDPQRLRRVQQQTLQTDLTHSERESPVYTFSEWVITVLRRGGGRAGNFLAESAQKLIAAASLLETAGIRHKQRARLEQTGPLKDVIIFPFCLRQVSFILQVSERLLYFWTFRVW